MEKCNRILLAISNFEYWLFLHTSDMHTLGQYRSRLLSYVLASEKFIHLSNCVEDPVLFGKYKFENTYLILERYCEELLIVEAEMYRRLLKCPVRKLRNDKWKLKL